MSRISFLWKCFLLLAIIMVLQGDVHGRRKMLRRKREWVIPPAKMEENKDYRHREYIARVRTDKAGPDETMLYALHGPGADEPPLNVFIIDRTNGYIRVTEILDREKTANYTFDASVRHIRDYAFAEEHLTMSIIVTDVNDNAPLFPKSGLPAGFVHEASPKGTVVTTVRATDADDPATPNADLRYEVIKQKPPSKMKFYAEPKTGEIKVLEPTLDREDCSSYVLTVKATDMAGSAEGLTGTGTVTVSILDVNDHPPVLDKETYSGSIEENAVNIEVMRFKASDLDEVSSDNWVAKYSIISGNEDGSFTIKTDPKTNEGILMVVKPLDYERMKEVNLEITVDNEEPYEHTYRVIEGADVGAGSGQGAGSGEGAGSGQGAGSGKDTGSGEGAGSGKDTGGGEWTVSGKWTGEGKGAAGSRGRGQQKGYPVKIEVKNVMDGPKFDPEIKSISVSEDKETMKVPMLLTNYAALDEDSGEIAKNVRYAKFSDPAGWLSVDSETGDINLKKVPDRESQHVVDGVYYAKILCMTEDLPAKTATGTLAIQVEDMNDHCPELTSNYEMLCTDEKIVYVSAHDRDGHHSSPPFVFNLVNDGTTGVWEMAPYNDTAVILTARDFPEPGFHSVAFDVTDSVGHSCAEPQVLEIFACNCFKNRTCKPQRRGRVLLAPAPAPAPVSKPGSFGGPAIGIMAGAFLMLLLIPLLLLGCNSGSGLMTEKLSNLPVETKEHLITYRTEAGSEDKAVPLLPTPVATPKQPKVPLIVIDRVDSIKTRSAARRGDCTDSSKRAAQPDASGARESKTHSRGHGSKSYCKSEFSEEDALPPAYFKKYYARKVYRTGAAEDGELVFEYEGEGSDGASVSGGSQLEEDQNLDFLDGLDAKFTTLAKICKGQEAATEVTTKVKTDNGVSATAASLSNQADEVIEEQVKMEEVNVEKVAKEVDVAKVSTEKVSIAVSPTVPRRLGHEEVVQQNQAYVIQQPVYVAAMPFIQAQYVVQPQVQQAVLVPMNQLQSLYVVGDAPAAEKLVVQESRVTGGAPIHEGAAGVSGQKDFMLVEKQVLPGGLVGLGAVSGLESSSVQGGVTGVSGQKDFMLVEKQVLPGGLIGLGAVSGLESSSVQGGVTGVSGQKDFMLVEKQVLPGGLVGLGAVSGLESSSVQGVVTGVSGQKDFMLVEKQVLPGGLVGLGAVSGLESSVQGGVTGVSGQKDFMLLEKQVLPGGLVGLGAVSGLESSSVQGGVTGVSGQKDFMLVEKQVLPGGLVGLGAVSGLGSSSVQGGVTGVSGQHDFMLGEKQVLPGGLVGLGAVSGLESSPVSPVQGGVTGVSGQKDFMLVEKQVLPGGLVGLGVVGGLESTSVHGGVTGVSGQKELMLVEKQVLPGGLVGFTEVSGVENIMLVRKGEQDVANLGGAQNVVLVEGQVGAGQAVRGGQSWIHYATLPRGFRCGARRLMLVEREGTGGQVSGSSGTPQQKFMAGINDSSPGSVQTTDPKKTVLIERQVKITKGSKKSDSKVKVKRTHSW